jgi:hypothetical protein
MILPKNSFTTNPPARLARFFYRQSVRPAVHSLRIAARLRLSTDWRGNSPDYLIIGVNKAGTTALHENLTSRLDVGVALRKEVHYFDHHPDKPWSWYRAHFWGSSSLLWGDATPEYFELADTPRQIRDELPNARIIVCLRDPFARAVSHFYNSVDHLTESRPIERAFADEAEKLARGHRAVEPRALATAYLQRSIYGRSLVAWRETFGDQLLVVTAERLRESIPSVHSHLGIPEPASPGPMRQRNIRPYAPPAPGLSSLLDPFVAADAPTLIDAAGWSGWPEEWRPL